MKPFSTLNQIEMSGGQVTHRDRDFGILLSLVLQAPVKIAPYRHQRWESGGVRSGGSIESKAP